MTCEICGTELTEDTISDIDENKCKICAPGFEDENNEDMDIEVDLEDNLDIDID